MMNLVIPTYNRPDKLARTLKCYAQFGSAFDSKIIILDGSDPDSLVKNQQSCALYKNVEHQKHTGVGLKPRLLNYFSQLDSDSLVCLGTDEDVFLPDYLSAGVEFLQSHPDYVTFIGRYITFARPLGFLPRMSQHRTVVTDLDVKQEDPYRRIALLNYANTLGSQAMYYGIRRAYGFVDSLKQRAVLKYYSSHEMVDFILLPYLGKIRIANTPMLLRDETKFDYKIEEIRNHPTLNFPPEEDDIVVELLRKTGGDKLLEAGQCVLDWVRQDYVAPGHPCLVMQANAKAYSKYEPIIPGDKAIVFRRVIYLFLKSALVFTEILIALREIRLLKKRYGSKLMNTFLRKTKVNLV